MNKIFKVVWSKSKECYVVVSEVAKNNGGKKKVLASVLAGFAMAGMFANSTQAAYEQWGGHASSTVESIALGPDTWAQNDAAVAIGMHNNANGTAPGKYSVALGSWANANGASSVALGASVNAKGYLSVAVGYQASANEEAAVALGNQVVADKNSTAVGPGTKANGTYSFAGGYQSETTGQSGVAIGDNAKSKAARAIAIGGHAEATAEKAIAIGGDIGDTTTKNTKTTASGKNAVAIGNASQATTNDALAVGSEATASGLNASAVGKNSKASGQSAAAFGDTAQATNTNATAVGNKANASNTNTTAIGNETTASGGNSTAIGHKSRAIDVAALAVGTNNEAGYEGTAVGLSNTVTGRTSAAFGRSNTVSGNESLAAGIRSTASGEHNVAIGYQAVTNNKATVAIGEGSKADIADGVAIGSNSATTAAAGVQGFNPADSRTKTYGGLTGAAQTSTLSAVAVGNGDTATRQITGLAAGTNNTDAVNVAQLKSVNLKYAADTGNSDLLLTDGTLTVKGDNDLISTSVVGTGADKGAVRITAKVGGTINNTDGKAVKPTTNGIATTDNVADAINDSYWKATAGGNTDTTPTVGKVKPGNQVTFSAGDNLKVKQTINNTTGDQEYKYSLNPVLTGITSIANTATGPKMTFGGSSINITGGSLDMGNNKITNLATGTDDKDAVNVKQLKDTEIHITPGTYTPDSNKKVTLTYENADNKTVTGKTAVIDLSGLATGGTASTEKVKKAANGANDTNIAEVNPQTGDTYGAADATYEVSVSRNAVKDAAREAVTVNNGGTTTGGTYTADTNNPISVTAVPDNTNHNTTYAVTFDGNKAAKQIPLTYKATNGTTTTADQTVKLDKGLNFTGGDYTTASVGADGKVTFDVNLGTTPTVTDGKPGVPGQAGAAGKDGIATVKTVVDTINNSGWKANAKANGGSLDGNSTATVVKPGDQVNFAAGKNLTVKQDLTGEHTYTYSLNKDVDLTNAGSLTVGDTTVNNGGITIKAPTPAAGATATTDVKLTNTGLDNGGNKIVNVANGDVNSTSKDAVNGSQLYTVDQKFNNKINLGADGSTETTKFALDNAGGIKFNIKGDGSGTSGANQYISTTANGSDIKLDLTDDAKAKLNKSYEVKSTDNSVKVSTTSVNGVTTFDLKVTPAAGTTSTWDIKSSADTANGGATATGHETNAKTIANTNSVEMIAGKNLTVKQTSDTNGAKVEFALSDEITVGKDGANGVDGKIGVNGKDGASVVINGKDGSIGLTGPRGATGAPGASATLNVKDGVPGVDGAPGTNLTRIVYTDKNNVEHEVATHDDGMKFAGDDGQANQATNANVIKKHLNNVVDIIGGATKADLTTNNIGVNNDGNGKLLVQLSKNLKDINTVKNGNTTITLNDAPGGATNTPAVTISGGNLSVGGNKVTNVDDGTDNNDAVNVKQLKAAKTEVKAGKNVVVTSETSTTDGHTTYTVNASTPVVYTTPDGTTKLIKQPDGTFKDESGNVYNGPVIASFEDSTGARTGGNMIVNNVGSAINNHATPGVTSPTYLDKLDAAAGDNNTKNAAVNVTDLKNTKDGLIDKGLKFDANVGGVKTNKLGSTVKVQGAGTSADADYSGTNIKTFIDQDGTGNTTIDVKLDKNLKGINKISNGGSSITLNDTPSATVPAVTISGGNLSMGDGTTNNKIVNLAPGTADTDAVNVKQLKDTELHITPGTYTPDTNKKVKLTYTDGNGALVSGKEAVIDLSGLSTGGATASTWNVKSSANTTDGGAVGATHDANAQNIANGKTVEFQSGKNLVVNQTNDTTNGNATVEFSLSDNITVGKDGANGKDGSVGAKGADGSAVVMNGKDGSIGLNGTNGANGISIKGKDGANGVGIDGKDGVTRIVYTEKVPDPANPGTTKEVTHEVATMDDGLKFTGNNTGTVNKHKLGSLVKVQGEGVSATDEAAFVSASGNIAVTAENNDTLTIRLNKNLKGLNSIQLGGNTIQSNGDNITFTTNGGTTKTVATTDQLWTIQANGTDVPAKSGKVNLVAGDHITITPDAANGKMTISATGFGSMDGFNVKTSAESATVGTHAGDTTENIKNGKTVDMQAGKNLVVTQSNDGNGNTTVNYALNKDVNLGNDGSLKAGDTTINKDGVTIANGPSITKTGVDAGDKKITNVADGDVNATSKDAVNGSQLKKYTDAAKTTVEAGDDNVKVDADNTAADGHTNYKVSLKPVVTIGDTHKVKIDGNTGDITGLTNVNLTDPTFATKGRAATEEQLKQVLNEAKNKAIEKVQAGTAAAGDTNIATVAPKAGDTFGTAGATYEVSVSKNAVKDAAKEAVKVTSVSPAITVTPDTSVAHETTYKVGFDGNQAATQIPLTYKQNGGNTRTVKLSDGLNFIDGTNTKARTAADGKVTFDVMGDLTGITSISNAAGGPKMTFGGNSINVTGGNLDMGGKKITNIGKGTDPTDAARVGQLTKVTSNNHSVVVTKTTDADGAPVYDLAVTGTPGAPAADPRVDMLGEEIGRVGAQGAALSALKPIQYDPLEPTQIMAGYGNYRGNSALALGVAHYKNESTLIHGGVSWAGGSSHMMANAGVTWKVGNRDSEAAVADRYRKGPISSAYAMQQEMASVKAQNAGLKSEVSDLKAENEQMKAQIAAMMAKLGM